MKTFTGGRAVGKIRTKTEELPAHRCLYSREKDTEEFVFYRTIRRETNPG